MPNSTPGDIISLWPQPFTCSFCSRYKNQARKDSTHTLYRNTHALWRPSGGNNGPATAAPSLTIPGNCSRWGTRQNVLCMSLNLPRSIQLHRSKTRVCRSEQPTERQKENDGFQSYGKLADLPSKDFGSPHLHHQCSMLLEIVHDTAQPNPRQMIVRGSNLARTFCQGLVLSIQVQYNEQVKTSFNLHNR